MGIAGRWASKMDELVEKVCEEPAMVVVERGHALFVWRRWVSYVAYAVLR